MKNFGGIKIMATKEHTCFFTGHLNLPKEQIEYIVRHLDAEIEWLINQGVTRFIYGGAQGFDLLAASLIATKKEMGSNIQLIFALPCKNHDAS